MKLMIDNRTEWDTRALRTVFLKVLNENIKFEGPLQHVIRPKVVYTRGGGYSGYAYYHSGRMRIRLPRPNGKPDEGLDVYKLANLFEHELAHCRGYRHKGMCGLNGWTNATAAYYPYLDGIAVTTKKRKPKPTIDEKYAKQLAKTLASMRRWQTKAKRASTALKKLDRQRKRIEKAMAEAAANKEWDRTVAPARSQDVNAIERRSPS